MEAAQEQITLLLAEIAAGRRSAMTPERWREITDAFSAVFGLPRAERDRYLTTAFAADAALLDEVAQLLRDAQAAEESGFLPPALIRDVISPA